MDVGTEDGFAGGNRYGAVNVVSLEAELLVGSDVDVQVKVAAVFPLVA